MTRKEWFAVLIPLMLVWLLDRGTKWLASNYLSQNYILGNLRLVYLENHGAMLGLFSELPAVLRIVSLSTGGAFLIVIFSILQYLMPIKSLVLRAGMSTLLGGILGNVYDRIVFGFVIDFISFRWGDLNSPVLNVADALQWVGYLMIFTALVKEGEILWPESESRKRLWINPDFQLRHSLQLLAVGIGVAIITGVFAFTYFRVTMIELIGMNPRILNKFLNPFLLTYIVVVLAFAAILLATGRYLSHRVAGPIYAFEKYVRNLMNEEIYPLKLRSRDEFQELEQLSRDLANYVEKIKKGNPTEVNQSELID